MHLFTIRPIEQKDNMVLAKIIRSAFKEYKVPTAGTVYEDPTTDHLYQLFNTDGAVCWVAEENAELLGCCGLYPTQGLPDGCVELVKFYLAAPARGKGVGKTLMQQCIQSAKEMHYIQIYLESLPQFSIAVNMYLKMEFVQIPQPLGNSGHSGCSLWMIKNLD